MCVHLVDICIKHCLVFHQGKQIIEFKKENIKAYEGA